MSRFNLDTWLDAARLLHAQAIRSGERAGLLHRGGGVFILAAIDIHGGARIEKMPWYRPDQHRTGAALNAEISTRWTNWERQIRAAAARGPDPQTEVANWFHAELEPYFEHPAPQPETALRSLTRDVIGPHGMMSAWRYDIVSHRHFLQRGLAIMTSGVLAAGVTSLHANIRGGSTNLQLLTERENQAVIDTLRTDAKRWPDP